MGHFDVRDNTVTQVTPLPQPSSPHLPVYTIHVYWCTCLYNTHAQRGNMIGRRMHHHCTCCAHNPVESQA